MNITAEQLYKIRKVYRLTQGELGALIGVSDAYINQIEHKKRPITQRICDNLTQELELTPVKLAIILALYDEYDGKRLTEV